MMLLPNGPRLPYPQTIQLRDGAARVMNVDRSKQHVVHVGGSEEGVSR